MDDNDNMFDTFFVAVAPDGNGGMLYWGVDGDNKPGWVVEEDDAIAFLSAEDAEQASGSTEIKEFSVYAD